MCGLTSIRNGFMSLRHIVFNSLSKWSTGKMLMLIPILSFGSSHKNDMVRMIKMQEFASHCISLLQITLAFGTINQTASLTHHSSTILTPFTSLWPKNSIHSIHPLHCLPPLLSNDYKKEHASCCPMFEQRLHNQKLRSKGHALGGSEINKIPTK